MSQAPAQPLRNVSRSVPLAALLNPVRTWSDLWRKRGLIVQFTQRELLSRNRGSVLGFFWTLLQPLLMLSVYTFVFAVVWKARWGTGADAASESNAIFALSVFCGLIVFDVFASTVGAAPALIVNHANFVKKVIFPLELLPLAQLGAALCTCAISTLILLVGNALFGTGISATLYYLPLVLAPVVLFAAGVAWLVASLGVFLRDLKQAVSGLLLPVLFFMTPIFYPADRVPEGFAWVLHVNPLAGIVENARRVALQGQVPGWGDLLTVSVLSLITFQVGYAFFMKSKRGFADVI
jgi:lipopolysaccharide transport system permease protein